MAEAESGMTIARQHGPIRLHAALAYTNSRRGGKPGGRGGRNGKGRGCGKGASCGQLWHMPSAQ